MARQDILGERKESCSRLPGTLELRELLRPKLNQIMETDSQCVSEEPKTYVLQGVSQSMVIIILKLTIKQCRGTVRFEV